MSRTINRPVFYCCARWVLAKKVVTFPVLRRSDRSGNESATTVRTDIAKDIVNAGRAERTFIGADACLKRVGRERFVAVFAGWPEFQHGGSSFVGWLAEKSAATSLLQSRKRIHYSGDDVRTLCEGRAIQRLSIWSVLFVWFIWFVSPLNQMNQRNQRNQRD